MKKILLMAFVLIALVACVSGNWDNEEGHNLIGDAASELCENHFDDNWEIVNVEITKNSTQALPYITCKAKDGNGVFQDQVLRLPKLDVWIAENGKDERFDSNDTIFDEDKKTGDSTTFN